MRHRTQFLVGAFLTLLVAASCSSNHSAMSDSDARVWRAALASPARSPLDGRAFDIEVREKGAAQTEREVIEFAGGRFHSRGCDPYGFGSGECATKAVDGGVEFSARCQNADGDVNEWRGRVQGAAIEGGFTWTPRGKSPVEHAFSGRSTQP